MSIDSVFILAAGKGERLRPLTEHTPKPLLEVSGKPILEHLFDRLKPLPLRNVFVNAWYLGNQIEDFVKARQANYPFPIHVIQEASLLGTGGGLKNAYRWLKQESFLMMNGDCLWEGDLQEFVSQSEQSFQKEGCEAVWALTKETSDQTRIGHNSKKVLSIGSLFQNSSEPVTSWACFSGIQAFFKLNPDQLPEKGCLVKDYWIPRLERGCVLGVETAFLKRWEDLGTIDRLRSFRL